MVLMMAAALVLSLSAQLLAKPVEKQKPRKRSVTGTIVKVDAKAQTIRVKRAASGQQVQTQSDPKQKDKKKKGPATLLIHVDKETKITVRTGQQQSKGQPSQEQEKPGFELLAEGQLVRVVFQVEAPKPRPGQEQEDPEQEQKEKEKPKQRQKDEPAPAVQAKGAGQQDADQQDKPKQKDKPDQEGPDKRRAKPRPVLRALSIEILKAASPGQQQSDK
jgi:hypothetical protein